MLRRIFLKKMALALCSVSWAGTVMAQSPPGTRNTRRVSSRKTLLGTDVSIVSYHGSVDFAQGCHEDLFRRAEVLSAIFSRHDTHSALSYLNATKSMKSAPPELLAVLGTAEHLHALSCGAFDIRVLPMLSLLEQESSPDQLEKMLQKIELAQHNSISIKNGSVCLGATTSLTLDGIAKGYIVDKMLELARDLGLEHCLVNAGGDIGCFGGVPGDAPWEIAVYNPFSHGLDPHPVTLRSGAVATSGGYFKPYAGTYHHILDPLHKISPWHHASVSVIAANAMAADAMATACMVLDTPRAQALLALHSMRGMFIRHDGAIT
ncbi:MAG: hypothetical protein BWK76_08700 [Desulfobulbaceae bacterium A2]|nr:MAG: hypothetical protein BWK76_08700 [Desulfobulbaceae bacterium A2]